MSQTIDTTNYVMLQKNKNLLKITKTIAGIGSGIVSGALGLVHYQGFLFMIIMYFIVSAVLYVKLSKNMNDIFTSSNTVWSEALGAFIMVCFLSLFELKWKYEWFWIIRNDYIWLGMII